MGGKRVAVWVIGTWFYSSVILNSTETQKDNNLDSALFYSSVILNSTETY